MKLRKAMLALVCALALVVGSVMGTMAYLTSTTDTVTNTFTVGNVVITLDETDVDVYGVKDSENRVTENTYKLIPGGTYLKDPTIHVEKGSEEAYLFVEVVDAIAAIEDETTVADQMTANGWTNLEGNVWYYNNKVDARNAADDIDVPVFTSFKILGTVDNDTLAETYDETTITVKAYAVQAAGFDTAALAWDNTFGA